MENQIKGVSLIFLSIALLIFATLPLDVHGQSSEGIKFSQITVADGLSHHETLFVIQDTQGFMWFGTKHGLDKYDGMSLTPFFHDTENSSKKEKSNSIVGNFAHWIHIDLAGDLWIATWGDGISRYDQKTGAFTNYSHEENNPHSLSSNNVWSIYVDSKGLVWAATDGGLSNFNPQTKKFVNYSHDPLNPNTLSSNTVSRICEDDKGIFWISTYGGGLNRFDPETETFTSYKHSEDDPNSLSNNNLWAVNIDSKGRIWIGSENGLNKFDPETETFTSYKHSKDDPNSLSSDIVTVMYEDKSGFLWLGTFGGGLNRFDPEEELFVHYKKTPQDPHSLSNNIIMSIYEDDVGSLWVATYGGINKYDPGENQFEHIHNEPDNPNDLNEAKVRSIYADRNGFVWIGTGGGGLNRFDSKSNSVQHYVHDESDPTSISGNDIWAISQDKRGDLWIGTHEAGLNKFDPLKQTFERYRHDPQNPNTLASNSVYDLVFDEKRDVLWIASYLSGLDKFDIEKQRFTHYRYDASNSDGIVSNWSTAVFVDSKGFVWVGTEAGLSRFNPATDQFSNFMYDINNLESLSNNMIQTIFEDSRNTVWIGTSDGLNRYDGGTSFIRFSNKDGLAGNYVAAIEEDKNGHLWISTDKGLSRFNPHSKTFRNYDYYDGLQGNRFLLHSSFVNEAGELFFGGENGFNVFNPDDLTDNEFIPKVVFTNFQLFNQPVSAGTDSPIKRHINQSQTISLNHDQNVFSIEFVALNYRNSRKNQYAYMLKGFDKDFVYTDSGHRSATYTNLDPGQYSFHVKASNNSGVWNENGRSIKIIIFAPWWETLWFRCTMLMLVAITIFVSVRLRMHSIKQINRRLEIQVADRTRELKAWLEHSPVCTKVVDLDFNLQYMSSAGIKGLQIENVSPFYGKPYPFDFFPESYQKDMIENLKKVRDTGEVITYEAPTFDIEGNELWFQATVLPVNDNSDRIESIIIVSVDTTARNLADKALQRAHNDLENQVQERTTELTKEIAEHKKSDEKRAELESRLHQAQKMEAIGTLAGGIAHDFNNILGTILGYTEMARDDSPSGSTVAKDLNKVLGAGRRAKDLVKQILAFSRQGDAERIPIQPTIVVNEAIKMLRPSLPTTIKINLNIAPKTGLILADPTQFNQILMNLGTNAFHAMEETGGKLDVSLKETTLSSEDLIREPDTKPGTFIQLSVCDSGPGMTPETKEKIFDPYFTTKEVGKGTGMGLSIVHGIVKGYGGFISLYSELGEGTAFHVYLPVIEGDELPKLETVEKIEGGKERVLFIDDEEILAEMSKDMLERLGYHVTVRNSSLEALETFQNQPDQFDIVITDQTMPGMTGSDLARRMMQIRSDIPIILCTGYSTIISDEKAKGMGIKEFALKPLTKKDIAQLIRKVLDAT